MAEKNYIQSVFFIALICTALAACGGSSSETSSQAPADSDLSLEAQIGPVTSVELGEIDQDLVSTGEGVFTMKCTACHGLDTKVIGPPLGNVLEIRSPVYVMNMILNPTEMLDQHPEAKKMLEEYVVPMVPLGVTEEEARAVVEYLRSRQYE